jgi:CubicO group peptidase (beta-lactamase class C family)
MFNELPQKFSPGERFGYSNAGFVLLGLVVEGVSKQIYQQYVTENIILPLGLSRTGFYRMNNLPGNTALGYLYNEARNEHETNTLYMPIIGGADGGIFSCAADIIKVWQAVLSGRIFSTGMVEQFLTPHITINENERCGLGVFIRHDGDKMAYYSVGGDFGVDYFSAYFPRKEIIASAFGNTEMNTFSLFKRLLEILE